MIEFLKHTADLKIRVSSSTLEGLFKKSLSAINRYLNPTIKKTGKPKEIVIEFEKKDILISLIDFLSEMLSKTYIEKRIFSVNEISFKDKIEIKLKGEEYKNLKREIKAVTYHQAKLKKERNKFIFEFIVDI